MEQLLVALKAAAEPTRLRLLALCAHEELSASELTQILGQSQPRVSRHLKLLCEAKLLHRQREGAWAFFRLSEEGRTGELARTLVDALESEDPVLALDLARLETIRRERREAAEAYFRRNAREWHRIRGLHMPEPEVEAALLALFPAGVGELIDIGTGTGRMLEVLAPRVSRGIGIDLSREMLAVARTNLERSGLNHCQVRHADMYRLPFSAESFDAATLYQVLHFADSPGDVITEAARVLRPGGMLLITDFSPHGEEALRADHAHRWLGFTDEEIRTWNHAAGLTVATVHHLPTIPLEVSIWEAKKSRAASG
jgi:ArsR family transcriptional regulator